MRVEPILDSIARLLPLSCWPHLLAQVTVDTGALFASLLSFENPYRRLHGRALVPSPVDTAGKSDTMDDVLVPKTSSC